MGTVSTCLGRGKRERERESESEREAKKGDKRQ